MGFMDKLKSVASAVTGSGAKVNLDIIEPSHERPFTVKVQATVGNNDLKIDKVYVKLVGEETVNLEVKVPDKEKTKIEKLSKTANTFHQEFELAGKQTLNADQMYEWEGTVQLPGNAQPSYQGVNAKHEWKLLAGLSTLGNDPDSGWVTIDV